MRTWEVISVMWRDRLGNSYRCCAFLGFVASSSWISLSLNDLFATRLFPSPRGPSHKHSIPLLVVEWGEGEEEREGEKGRRRWSWWGGEEGRRKQSGGWWRARVARCVLFHNCIRTRGHLANKYRWPLTWIFHTQLKILQHVLKFHFTLAVRFHSTQYVFSLPVSQDLALIERCLQENAYDADLAIVELLQLMTLSTDQLCKKIFTNRWIFLW